MKTCSRRVFLGTAGGVILARLAPAAVPETSGVVTGYREAADCGNRMLADGGNAVDAAVTAALVACVMAVQQTGLGGYGGHLVIGGLPKGRVTAIDFNGTAPAAITPDYFKANDKGEVKGSANSHGWLAAGVPGVPAGLQLALDKFGTRKFAAVVQPALKIAREGFEVDKALAFAIKGAAARLKLDPGSAKLLLPRGEPLAAGDTLKNPDLAKLLETLAEAGSVAPFYKGKVADTIAAEFKANGGLLTADDLAGYKAVEVEPLAFEWNGYLIHTPPPTAGGLTVLQTLSALRALGWSGKNELPYREYVETLRVAWHDRLALLGDPAHADVPVKKLLSEEYAAATAERVRAAIKAGKPIEGSTDGRPAGGTIHLNAVDKSGLAVALTLTHGEYFGAQVTVDGLGLVLGHGVSRFDPRPGHPNSIGPGKRPLHNMCPTVATKDGTAVLALGAAGGRRIVNSVAYVLAHRIGAGMPLAESVKAPRIHTEGDLTLGVEVDHSAVAAFKAAGYAVKNAPVAATLGAISRDPQTGALEVAVR